MHIEIPPGDQRHAYTQDELLHQLRALGVAPGDTLLVHTSFRAVRPVANGPAGLVSALLRAVGPDGTLVMPSWPCDDEQPFDPSDTPAAEDLGIVADTFWRVPGVLRSHHSQAFAAAGTHAEFITSDPLPLPPHIPASPVGRVHDVDGKVLLLGVGHDANTTLHLAEVIAGVPYGIPRYCMDVRDGHRVRIEFRENDHCCERFALADEWLRDRGLLREGNVGHASARLMRSRDIVNVAVAQIERDPLVFLHAVEDGCADCDEARDSIPRDWTVT